MTRAALGLDATALLAREGEAVSAQDLARIDALVARRLAGEPVARILGEWEFYGLPFLLGPATLVPRPETERLVDLALAQLGGEDGRVLDLGTGTGCIALSILVHAPGACAVAVDLSPDALVVARRNAERLGVADRIAFRQGSWLAPIAEDERFDVIVSNPPYIESAAIGTLMAEVRDHDPRLALDGGPDGLAPYRDILARARRHLAPGGLMAVEIGAEQGEAVSTLARSAGFSAVEVEKDLAGLDRVVLAHHS